MLHALGDVPPGTSPIRVNFYWPDAASVRAARARDPVCTAACTKQPVNAVLWHLPAHLAPGMVALPFGIVLPLTAFQTMAPKTIELAQSALPPGMWDHLDATQIQAAVDRWNQVRQYGKGSVMQAYNDVNAYNVNPYLSLKQFVAKYPEFVTGEYAGLVPPPPTNDELTKSEGVRKYNARGGWLISRDIFDGKLPIIRSGPVACVSWCKCGTETAWPERAYCSSYLGLETDNFDWGVFVARLPNERIRVIYQRLPKSTWQSIEDGIDFLLSKIRDALNYVCNHQGAVTAAVTAASAGGGTAAAVAMSRYCGAPSPTAPTPTPAPAPQPPASAPRTPTSAIVPWYKRGSTYAIGAGAVAAIGVAALLARR